MPKPPMRQQHKREIKIAVEREQRERHGKNPDATERNASVLEKIAQRSRP